MGSSGYWPGFEPKRTEPLVNTPTAGGLPGPIANTIHVPRNTSLELCWQQERVACIYDNWQSIFEDPPDALNTDCRNGRSPADSNQ